MKSVTIFDPYDDALQVLWRVNSLRPVNTDTIRHTNWFATRTEAEKHANWLKQRGASNITVKMYVQQVDGSE